MKFVKMEGCANDFIVTDDISGGTIERCASSAPRLCDRRRGIGADGIVLVLDSDRADYAMRIFNADGSEAEMCGNGIRCLARYVREHKHDTKQSLAIETQAGIIQTECVDDGTVRVNMGTPILTASKIPVVSDSERFIAQPLEIDGKTFVVTAVSMGNPHAVIYADELTDELVLGDGARIEPHEKFPNKTNVEFIKVLSESEIRMRVFERGVGETMACGTGACASAVAGIINKKHGARVTVHLLGGDLIVEWDGNEGAPVYMTGPAESVFEGTIDREI
jgi:diaminopimelate epimerase